MKLKLKVTTYQGQSQQYPEEYTFDHNGGSFGRGQGNIWKLRDENNFLSRTQANITFQNNLFYLVDVSSNGCYVNNSDFPLGRDNSHHLEHGDAIRVGEYILEASIINQPSIIEDSLFSEDEWTHNEKKERNDPSYTESVGKFSGSPPQGESVVSDDPFNDVFNPVSPHTADSYEQPIDQQENINNAIRLTEPEVDNTFTFSHSIQADQENKSKGHTKIFGLSDSYNTDWNDDKENNSPDDIDENPNMTVASSSSQNQVTDASSNFLDQSKKKPLFTDNDTSTSQNMEKEVDQLEEDTSFQNTERRAVEEKSKIEVTDTPANKNVPQSHDDSLETLLEGAGVDPEQIKKEIPDDIYLIIGKILHEALQGTMDLLKSRTETKNHLRLDKTIIGNTQNNPLKFMPNAENVIVQLFTSGNPKDQAYLSLLDAMEEAFDDIKAHQFAMAMSIQQALTATMKHYFSPENLQRKLEKSSPISSKIPLQRQAKLWKMFEGTYEEIEREASEGFDALLDREIAKAYELHMMEIKYQRKNKRK